MTNANIKRAALIFGLLVMLALLTPALCAAQTPEPEPPTTNTNAVERARQEVVKAKSVVRGRAVYDDTGRPVRRARVMLLEANSQGPERTGMTNAAGEFQIKDVPAGSYFVMVDAAGIITPLSLIDIADINGDKLNVEEIKKYFEEVAVNGTNDVTVKVRARRGGAISGKVTYADGDPAINVRVSVMRKKDGHLSSFITNFNPSAFFGIQTDDRGMYRIAGLPPGEYIVGASETIDHSGDASKLHGEDFMFGTSSLVVTYYQGTSKQASATAIQVDAGQEQNEVNITLSDRPLRTLSGTVVARRDGTPLSAQISLTSKDTTPAASPFMPMTNGVSTDEQGRFTFNEIPDGVYTLTVEPMTSAPSVDTQSEGDEQPAPPLPPPDLVQIPDHKYTRKVQDVTVADGDLTNVVIALTEGASVSGRVMLEGDQPLPEGTYITLEPVNREGAYGQQDLLPTGSFAIDGVMSGAFYPHVYVMEADQYYVKEMTAGGEDLTRNPLVINESENVTDIRVVLSADGATLSGHILTGDNTPASRVRFALIPTDQTKWRAFLSHRFATSESDGSYSVSGAPGEYFLIFLRAGDQPVAINEAWIRERVANAQRVMLQPREHKTLNLTAPAQ